MDSHTETTPGATGTSGAETPRIQEKVKEQAHQVAEKTQQVAGQVADQARHQVKSQFATGKERATDSLGSVADAMRLAGDQLREQQHEHIGRYADSAAEMVQNVSRYLSDRDVDRLVGDVENFARRQPALFLGGAFALGFMASRFLKSSSPSNGGGGGYSYQGNGGGSRYGHPLPTAAERTASGTPPFDVPVSGTASPSVAGTGAGLDVPPATGMPRD